ncbi:MAG: hypothetical protein WD469_08430 [Paenibacillaceae bacterium]
MTKQMTENLFLKMSGDTIKELIQNPIQYELVTFEDGTQVKVRTLNSVSDQARIDINNVFKQLVKDGKIT